MQNDENVKATDLVGIYKDIANVIGVDATLLLHGYLKGQQITFPKKLYSKDYIIKQVKKRGKRNIKAVATQYGYTERRLQQIVKENDKGDKGT